MNAADPSAPIRTAPLALWRVARAFLVTLHMLFGDPAAVATQHTLTGKAHAQMASWLRCAEAMLRRLILIEASAYPKPNTRPLLTPRRARTKKLYVFLPEKPEDWRVSFRCFAPGPRKPRAKPPAKPKQTDAPRPFIYREDHKPRAQRPSRRTRRVQAAARSPMLRQDRVWKMHAPRLRFHSAWPLAQRFEALIRVFNDPTAHARRLAARLHATPHRLLEVLRAAPEARNRVDGFELAGRFALHRWRRRESSA